MEAQSREKRVLGRKLKYERKLVELQRTHRELDGCWCQLQLDTPFDHWVANGRRVSVYYCKFCGNQRTLARGLHWPCYARGRLISTWQFLRTLHGNDWTSAWHARRRAQQNARVRRGSELAAAAVE